MFDCFSHYSYFSYRYCYSHCLFLLMIMMIITFSEHYFSSSYRYYLLYFLLLPILTMTVQTVCSIQFQLSGSSVENKTRASEARWGFRALFGSLPQLFRIHIETHVIAYVIVTTLTSTATFSYVLYILNPNKECVLNILYSSFNKEQACRG